MWLQDFLGWAIAVRLENIREQHLIPAFKGVSKQESRSYSPRATIHPTVFSIQPTKETKQNCNSKCSDSHVTPAQDPINGRGTEQSKRAQRGARGVQRSADASKRKTEQARRSDEEGRR